MHRLNTEVAANWTHFKAQLKYGQSIHTPSPRQGLSWRSNVQLPQMVAPLWGHPQESKEWNTKIHMGRNGHKGLLEVTLDLGHPRRNTKVLQDAVFVAQDASSLIWCLGGQGGQLVLSV